MNEIQNNKQHYSHNNNNDNNENKRTKNNMMHFKALRLIFAFVLVAPSTLKTVVVMGAQCTDLANPYIDDPPCSKNELLPNPDADGVYDVVIVGAGLAAIGAARELQIYNTNVREVAGELPITYCVLEIDQFASGRSVAAQWVAGTEGNILGSLAWEMGILDEYVDLQNFDDIDYNTEESQANLNKIKNAFKLAYECMWEASVKYKEDPSNSPYNDDSTLRDVLDECYDSIPFKNNPFDNYDPDIGDMRTFLELFNLDWEYGMRPVNTGIGGSPLYTYTDMQDKSWSVSHPNNSAFISEAIAAEAGICPNIQLETEVCLVDWNNPEEVQVWTRKPGDSGCRTNHVEATNFVKANNVIITTSVGVLNERGDSLFGNSMFDPSLPNLAAMRRVLGMVEYMDISFKFSETVWDETGWGGNQFIAVEMSGRGPGNFWQVLDTNWKNEFRPGSHVVQTTLTTELIEELVPGSTTTAEARNFLASSASDAETLINKILQDTLGTTITDFTLPVCSREEPFGPSGWDIWEDEPTNTNCGYLTYPYHESWAGSYSNWLPGGSKADFDAFIQPVGPTSGALPNLFLAGEGTCERYFRYTHGAFMSGIREMNRIIDKLDGEGANPDPTPQFCEETPQGGPGNMRVPKGV